MKIGVIADTHIPRAAKKLPEKVLEAFDGVEMIIHAGDIVEKSVLEDLGKVAPVKAVFGNRDSDELKRTLPETRILEVKGFRIGIFHGHGDEGTTLKRMPSFFKGIELDCIVFGHSHIPWNQLINGTLYFNPGSPTVKKRQKYPSVGFLTLEGAISAEILYLI